MNAKPLAVNLIRHSEIVFQKLDDQFHPIKAA